MAWNNVRNEPRREWIEQLLGLFALIFIAFVDCYLSSYFLRGYNNGDRPVFYGFLLFVIPLAGALGILLLFGVWYLAHEAGELVCAMMTAIGFDPRPNPRENTDEYRKARGTL